MAQAHEQDRPAASEQKHGQKRIAVHTKAGRSKASAGGPDVAEVQVSETRFKRLAVRRQYLRKLLAN